MNVKYEIKYKVYKSGENISRKDSENFSEKLYLDSLLDFTIFFLKFFSYLLNIYAMFLTFSEKIRLPFDKHRLSHIMQFIR